MAHPYYGTPSGCPPVHVCLLGSCRNPIRPTAQSRPHTLETRDALLPSLARTRCPCTPTFGAWKGVLAAVGCR